jgi:uncharacterized membrane protein YcaP (DUF421 family)
MQAIEWHSMFVPKMSLLELILRGTLMYLGIFLAMRFFRRTAGGLGIADVLLVVLVADAAQNAMSNQYGSVTEGAVLVGTIFAWDYLLDWLEFRFPRLRPLLQPRPLPLIEKGRVNRRNLRAEMISPEELNAKLREHGVESVTEVKSCRLEADGQLSVTKLKAETDETLERKRKPMG